MADGVSTVSPSEPGSPASEGPAAKRARYSAEPAGGREMFVALGLPMDVPLVSSYTFFSPLPAADSGATGGEGEGFVLGVDEAGRGPVLGPMVYATCFCRESYYEQLSSVGFADSKQLTQEQRERLFARLQGADIRAHAGWSIRCIAPQDISQCMLRRTKYSLNALAHDATIQLLSDVLERGIPLRRVFIDTVGPPASYQAKLRGLFPQIEITVAKKADSIYPIVSAASICAKVTRDAHLDHWAYAEAPLQGVLSRAYGSGYPSDPNTTRWLRESVDHVFGYPGIIRFSWSTCTKLLEERAARVAWADDEDSGGRKPANRASNLFARAAKGPAEDRQQSTFFRRNRAVHLASSL
ncbi:hypothetical protein H4R21_000538 [Coemansia helicoidea]|uniref:Uncharacterized protein n=1 Tax=Coemansia helicoidea TaxID=1286919 RepID=A0ACC1LEV4_9FUNG|nr:hypothetical protein H4R21_000538 [Coemansia helicoidea]